MSEVQNVRAACYAVRGRPKPTNRRGGWLVCLLVGGLLLALVDQLMAAQYSRLVYLVNGDSPFPDVLPARSTLYLTIHALQIAFLTLAGVLALIQSKPELRVRLIPALILFMAAATVMTVRGFDAGDWVSTKVVHASGVYGAVISVLMFCGLIDGLWVWIDRCLTLSCIVFTGVTIIAIVNLATANRGAAVSTLHPYLLPLSSLAGWVCLGSSQGKAIFALRLVSMSVYTVGSIMTQTRQDVLCACLIILAFLFVSWKNGIIGHTVIVLGPCLVGLALVAVALLIKGSSGVFDDALSALDERLLNVDTRSGQLSAFFDDVELSELVFGRGALVPWNWMGRAYTAGPDVGYLSLLYFGGIPLLFTYIVVHLKPAVAVLLSSATTSDGLRCALIVIIWFVKMSAACPLTLTIEYYPVLLCVGGCVLAVAGSVRRRVVAYS